MIFKSQILFYNHCKLENQSKYRNVECNFSLNNFHNTVHNIVYKLCYLFLSLPIISGTISFFQTLTLIMLSYGEVPSHLSYIMDGNRRFAKSINQPLKNGHEIGSTTLQQVIHFANAVGVKHLSVYAFSIENFNRSEKEVKLLMNLLVEKLTDLSDKIKDKKNSNNKVFEGMQIKVVGDRSYLTKEVVSKINEIELKTQVENPADVNFSLYVCCPYTSRNEIYHSIKSNIKLKKEYGDEYLINEASLERQMVLSQLAPKCDLLIRTSGATRFSDYLMWQSHNQCSFVFSETFWPDYGFRSFVKDIVTYSYFKSLYSWNQSEEFAHKSHSCLLNKQFKKIDDWRSSIFQSAVFEKQIFFPLTIVSRAMYKGKSKVSYEDLKLPPKSASIIERN